MSKFSAELIGIRKIYDRPILEDINLSLASESYISIVGKSGSGKSTLMNILGLIEHFDGGSYLFDGVNIENKKDFSRLRLEKIGFIFQSYNLISTLTCRENILLPCLYARKTPDISYLSSILDIKMLLDTNVNVLSGGEKQRVAIARALILDPPLLIADEPTGNLDEENKFSVMSLLKKINAEGHAIIVITHDKGIASEAKQKYELKDGVLNEKE
ncbi:MAG: ABC transporter ATP-binding protein [Clostridia bacterium]